MSNTSETPKCTEVIEYYNPPVPVECYNHDAEQAADSEALEDCLLADVAAADDASGLADDLMVEDDFCDQSEEDAWQGWDFPESHNQEVGRRGECAAAAYLERRGFKILERNWRCPAGEADIIALDEDSVVFIEVKTRTSTRMGFPAEAVDEAKRARYEKIAACYLSRTDYVNVPVRFDVMSLLVIAEDRALVKHHVNAFGVA